MPLVTFSVFASGDFSRTSSRPGPPLTTASPISGCGPCTTSATSPRRTVLPPLLLDGQLCARSRGCTNGRTGRIPSRLVRGVDPAAGADHVAEVRVAQQARVQRVRGGVHDLVERHVLGLHARRVDVHVLLLEALAPDRDVHHAGHSQQACPDLPVGDRRELLQRHLVRGDADLHDPARPPRAAA